MKKRPDVLETALISSKKKVSAKKLCRHGPFLSLSVTEN